MVLVGIGAGFGGFDDPGIAGILLGIVSLLGAIDGALLLRLADENYAFAMRIFGSKLGGDIVLALSFFEGDQGNLLVLDELLDGLYESPRLGLNGIGGKDLSLTLVADKVQRAFQDLEPSDEDVQIHAVDGFGFQNDVTVQHVGHSLW